MAISLLNAVRSVCGARALARPTAVMNSANETYIQFAEAANRLVWFMAAQEGWQGVIKEAAFNSVAGSDQGRLKTKLSDEGFQSICGQKIFNFTDGVMYAAPQFQDDWQVQKNVNKDIPEGNFRVYGDKLYLHSTMPASKSLRFEYYSKYLVRPTSGADKESFTADTDTFLLDDRLFVLGLEYVWLGLKGMENAAAEAAFMAVWNKVAAVDGVKPDIHLDNNVVRPWPWVNAVPAP